MSKNGTSNGTKKTLKAAKIRLEGGKRVAMKGIKVGDRVFVQPGGFATSVHCVVDKIENKRSKKYIYFSEVGGRPERCSGNNYQDDITYIDWYPHVNELFNKRQNLQCGVTIGMFGTCGGSKWRDPFMQRYSELGMHCYNPQVDDWTPECATEEARHLAEDKIILFPITSETYASGSLTEVGFSILNAIRLDSQRYFVIMISKNLDEKLKENQLAYKDSLKARALALEHLRKLRLDNLYVVETLEQMLEVSISVYQAARITEPFASYNPHRQPRPDLKPIT